MVELLIKAGATLAGLDHSGYARLAVQNARRTGDNAMLKAWSKAGLKTGDVHPDNIGQGFGKLVVDDL